MECVVCGRAPLRRLGSSYQHVCDGCGHRASDLAVRIGEAQALMDEARRERALLPLRRQNFEAVLRVVRELGLAPPATLLDVGCAHGWFLDAARAAGYRATGVEPDAAVAAAPRAAGHTVHLGYFPQALDPQARFDAVSLHDVFEHLPDPDLAARSIHDALEPGGLAILNLPSREGALFRLASALARLGFRGPLDRLWQRGFPSPHLHYFSPDGLARLMARHGLREVHRGGLPSVIREGLWARLRFDAGASWWVCAVQWCALSAGSRMLGRLPPDISLQVFQRS